MRKPLSLTHPNLLARLLSPLVFLSYSGYGKLNIDSFFHPLLLS